MITIRFAGWISVRMVSLQPDTDIQKLLSNGNRILIRISETLLSIFRGLRSLEKVAYCTFIHYLQKHPFSLLCHDSESVYGVISVPYCNPIPLLICKLDTPSLSAWICSWCGKIRLFQYTVPDVAR